MLNPGSDRNAPLTVAVIGASGFVGMRLLPILTGVSRVLALTRSKPKNLPGNAEWRAIDLFSARSTAAGLKGVDIAIYLVHSMMPSSRLFQGTFHDTDLMLADNFVRGCVANEVKHIVYLGGLMPEGYVSPHLQSRLEVEELLFSAGIPLTALRAGMIVGEGGASFEILRTLVQRLPFMILPRWTKRTTQAVYIDDVIDVIAASLRNPEFRGRIVNVVSGESLTYEILLRQMSESLGKKRRMIPVPIQSTRFSKLWVQIFGDSTRELVSPLLDSLLCDLPQLNPDPLIAPLIRYHSFRSMADKVLKFSKQPVTKRSKRPPPKENTVRSIQRLPSLPNRNSYWIAQQYISWLPGFLPFLLKVKTTTDGKVDFSFSLLPWPLLTLQFIPGPFDEDRVKFHIVGGLLSGTNNTGWLEFRQIDQKKFTLAAIHEFVPALPWFLYLYTQALVHSFVMYRFGKYLEAQR